MSKRLYVTLSVLCISFIAHSQCIMQVSCNWVFCYGACDGVAQAFPVNMTAPITYQWLPGGQTTQIVTGLCAGTYTCVAVDSLGCTATAQCTVGSPTQLQVSISSYQNPSCQSCCDGYAIGTATGGTPPYTYLWMPIGQTAATAQGLCSGTYTLCVTDASNCTSCGTISVSFLSSIADQQNETEMNVWGMGGLFTVSAQFVQAASSEVVVTNTVGAVVWRQLFGEAQTLNTTVDLKNQAQGLYLVSVITESGVTTRRIVNK